MSILNGGLDAWKSQGGPIDTFSPPPLPSTSSSPPTPFLAKLDRRMVVAWQDVLNVVKSGQSQICDARSRDRFLGLVPEPRPGLLGGHIPGSLSVPFTKLVVEGQPTVWRSKEEIRDVLVDAGVIFGSNCIVSCGSGVTACYIPFALELIGKDISMAPLYDGSWTEWATLWREGEERQMLIHPPSYSSV